MAVVHIRSLAAAYAGVSSVGIIQRLHVSGRGVLRMFRLANPAENWRGGQTDLEKRLLLGRSDCCDRGVRCEGSRGIVSLTSEDCHKQTDAPSETRSTQMAKLTYLRRQRDVAGLVLVRGGVEKLRLHHHVGFSRHAYRHQTQHPPGSCRPSQHREPRRPSWHLKWRTPAGRAGQ